MAVNITTSISPELHKLCQDNKIAWAEALRVGAAMMLAEQGVRQYDNSLNLFRKMRFYQQKVEEMSQLSTEATKEAMNRIDPLRKEEKVEPKEEKISE